MKKVDEIKEKIINAAEQLIVKSNGDIETITTRAIAENAGVAIGLINYHFQTKENLVGICVEKMIGKVISEFKPTLDENLNPIEKLKIVARSVVDFLMEHPSVARISILSDYNKPQILDNTMRTVLGFTNSLEDLNISAKDKSLLLFGLTSILQAAFLRKEYSKELLGFDLYIKKERDSFIDFIVERLFKEGKL